MRVVKDSWFWKVADAFEMAHSRDYKHLWKAKDYKNLWKAYLSKTINDFLDELEKNEKIDFSRNDIEEVKIALDNTFSLAQTQQTQFWIKEKLMWLLWKK